MQKLKRTAVLFLLLIFLFPLVETGLHNYDHRNDFHCFQSGKHFHKAEHHCNLCDFITDFSIPPTFSNYSLPLNSAIVIKYYAPQNNYQLQSKGFLSLRAPPVV